LCGRLARHRRAGPGHQRRHQGTDAAGAREPRSHAQGRRVEPREPPERDGVPPQRERLRAYDRDLPDDRAQESCGEDDGDREGAGMGFGDIVSARVFITDAAAFQDMNTAYRTYFPTAPPACATVKAGLTTPDYLVEITMVAVKDASRAAIATPTADGTAPTPNP